MRILKNQLFQSDISCAFGMNLPDELKNPKILHMNRLSPRATVIPSQKTGITYKNRHQSDRLQYLNGDYRFALFDTSAPDNFEKPDFDDADWDIIDVPSMWQFRGYGEPSYPNTEYPFPYTPPVVNRLNPVGCYRRTFVNDGKFARSILHFEGVDNAFYVYINGEFAGFSKGSRLPAEFDITDYLSEGENLIAVKVYTYSDASYLENQDMLLASGIFRDVYIIHTNEISLWDYAVYTTRDSLHCEVTLSKQTDNTQVMVTVDGKSSVLTPKDNKASMSFTPDSPKLWTAETPNLYDFSVEIIENGEVMECHTRRIGFRDSEIVNKKFLVNGTPILFRGINRHENNPLNGRTVTDEEIYNDLKLIKDSNINAIRCSHYPNNYVFYEYASELGIYVMDECDIETHGAGITGDQGALSKTPLWRDAYLDRIERTWERDKNETCIVVQSLCNECGFGCNTDDGLEYLQKRPFKKPVQYSQGTFEKHELNEIQCGGYPDIAKMQEYMEKYTEKPLLMTEYAHAMGNSPGNIRELWDFVLQHQDSYIGGFAWEFRGHGMQRVAENGITDYLYGGDFHDDNHWSNFTLDGYLTSDSTPKPTFDDLKFIYAPVTFKLEDGKIYAKNMWDFVSTNTLKLKLQLLCDSETVYENEFMLPDILPQETKALDFTLPHYNGCECFLTLSVYDGDNNVALEQIELMPNEAKKVFTADEFSYNVEKDNASVKISGNDFHIAFKNGLPSEYEVNGKVYFDKQMEFVTHRAYIDNDGIENFSERHIEAWKNKRLDKTHYFCNSLSVKEESDSVTIHTEGVITATHCYTGFNMSSDYVVYNHGLMLINHTVKPYGNMPEWGWSTTRSALPRFGMVVELNKEFSSIDWYGRGPKQNYDDAKHYAPVGRYMMPIEDLNFKYDVPQETGTRCDVRFLRASDTENALTIYGSNTVSFSYHPWALNDLVSARHLSELKESDKNYLYIDYKMRPLGSRSCGPEPEENVDFIPHDFEFAFAISGESAQTACPRYALNEFAHKTQKLTERYEKAEIVEIKQESDCKD